MISSRSSSARKHRDSRNTVAVQAGVQHRHDGRRQQDPDRRCRWSRTVSVSAQCQVSDDCVGNLCRFCNTCRDKVTPTSVHWNDHTHCECDSGFELKLTARVAVYQLTSTMLGTCSRMPLSSRKLPSSSVMCSACRVSSVTAESRSRPREHCAMSNQRIPSTVRQHQLSRRPCTSRVQL